MQRRLEINVLAEYGFDGIHPRSIELPGGEVYNIKNVLGVTEFPGSGTRFVCNLGGRIRYIWLVHDKWYVYGDAGYFRDF